MKNKYNKSNYKRRCLCFEGEAVKSQLLIGHGDSSLNDRSSLYVFLWDCLDEIGRGFSFETVLQSIVILVKQDIVSRK